jgi:hypothetical protein
MEGLKTSQRGDNGWPIFSCELRCFYFLATRGRKDNVLRRVQAQCSSLGLSSLQVPNKVRNERLA